MQLSLTLRSYWLALKLAHLIVFWDLRDFLNLFMWKSEHYLLHVVSILLGRRNYSSLGSKSLDDYSGWCFPEQKAFFDCKSLAADSCMVFFGLLTVTFGVRYSVFNL